MNNKMYLQEQFKELKNDSRMNQMMSSAQNCSIQFFVLEIQTETSINTRLLYSWIFPSSFSNNQWSKSDVFRNWKPVNNSYKASLYKFALSTDGQSIYNLIKKLIDGESILQACTGLDIKLPHEKFYNFALISTKEKIKNYVVRPSIFLKVDNDNVDFKKIFTSFKSPSKFTSCFSASLFCLEKLEVWKKDYLGIDFLDDLDNLAHKTLETLTLETGLSFNQSGSSRLGNIEWFSFPSSNFNDTPVNFSPIKTT